MARPGPRRVQVDVRLLPDAVTVVDDLARAELPLKSDGKPNRSAMVRRLLGEALQARAQR